VNIMKIALLPLACGMAAAGWAQTGMSRQDYGAAKERIEAEYEAAKAGCDRLSGNAKDICMADAKGKQRVAEAELAHQRSGTAADARKAAFARADAAYELAKERCDDLSGNDKDVCVKEAKATEARAKADVKP
jgi:hypothetical protein